MKTHEAEARITPAWAGKRSWAAAVARGHPDHPRMGGEKAPAAGHCSTDTGSPPRRRGKDIPIQLEGTAPGITPAWAGKRYSDSAGRNCTRDHPRMGGEKLSGTVHKIRRLGSPPHGRGKVITAESMTSGSRITPAWAGKSKIPRLPRQRHRDHPRMGGEKAVAAAVEPAPKGSPPHGRGKADFRCCCSRAEGITPAWAGKSGKSDRRCCSEEDHPRMGGEKVRLPGAPGARLGSPPHGRGKVEAARSGASTVRITPAWAGKSSAMSSPACRPGDHPRMGGEKTKKIP